MTVAGMILIRVESGSITAEMCTPADGRAGSRKMCGASEPQTMMKIDCRLTLEFLLRPNFPGLSLVTAFGTKNLYFTKVAQNEYLFYIPCAISNECY